MRDGGNKYKEALEMYRLSLNMTQAGVASVQGAPESAASHGWSRSSSLVLPNVRKVCETYLAGRWWVGHNEFWLFACGMGLVVTWWLHLFNLFNLIQ